MEEERQYKREDGENKGENETGTGPGAKVGNVAKAEGENETKPEAEAQSKAGTRTGNKVENEAVAEGENETKPEAVAGPVVAVTGNVPVNGAQAGTTQTIESNPEEKESEEESILKDVQDIRDDITEYKKKSEPTDKTERVKMAEAIIKKVKTLSIRIKKGGAKTRKNESVLTNLNSKNNHSQSIEGNRLQSNDLQSNDLQSNERLKGSILPEISSLTQKSNSKPVQTSQSSSGINFDQSVFNEFNETAITKLNKDDFQKKIKVLKNVNIQKKLSKIKLIF